MKYALLAALMFTGGYAGAQYCTPTYVFDCQNGHDIRSVSTTNGTTNFSNNNTGCTNPATSYEDYTGTSMKVTQEAYKSVDVKVTWGNATGASAMIKIWVDWDQNEKFDNNEYIAPSSTVDHIVSGSLATSRTIKITVPGYAKNGLTRMRIRVSTQVNGNYDAAATPCNLSNYGEAEDYNFEVINPCLPPDVISFSNVDYQSADIAWSEKLNAETYEYIIKKNSTPPAPNTAGYNYSKAPAIHLDNLECDVRYYLFLRCVCDSSGTAATWDMSDWRLDSFKTDPCCYMPDVKVDNITSTEARLSWDPVATSYGYEYAVVTTKNPPLKGNYTTNTTVVVQGLPPKTTHYVYVRSRCTPTPLSGWEERSFKTLKGVSVNEVTAQPISVNAYPVPVQDRMMIEVTGIRGDNGNLTIADLTGKIVYKMPMNSDKAEVNTSSLPGGIYIIKYSDDLHNKVIKVTKQ